MPHWRELVDHAWLLMKQEPLLTVAAAGFVFSAGYLLALFVTRLGDVRRSMQTFILSAALHVLLTLFWGGIALRFSTTATAPVEIPVRQVIIEDQGRTLDPEAVGEKPVWEEFQPGPESEASRMQERRPEENPLDLEERLPDAVAAVAAPLARLPTMETTPTQTQTVRPELSMSRSAVEEQVDLDEETAQARPESRTPQQPRRTRTRDTEVATSPATGEPRAPRRTSPAVRLNAPQALDGTESLIPDAPRPGPTTTSQAGPVRTGKPSAAPVEEGDGPGTEGVAGAPGAGATGKFSRVGRNPKSTSAARAIGGASPSASSSPAGDDAGRPVAVASSSGVREFDRGGVKPGRAATGSGDGTGRDAAPVAAPYESRTTRRTRIPEGASRESEAAVERALKWLAQHQEPEGFWDADGFTIHCPEGDLCTGHGGQTPADEKGPNRQQAGQRADPGLTGLAVLCYLGADYTHERGAYADNVQRAIRWLIRNQGSNGCLAPQAGKYELMYCHAIATYALAEAYGMTGDLTSDPELREAVANALDFIIARQNPNDGGWRYEPGMDGDMSMFGWQLMALRSAEIAGFEVPRNVRRKMVAFLKDRSLGQRQGLSSYRVGEKVSSAMTAEALFSKQILGLQRDNSASEEAVDYILKHPPRLVEIDLYYWYYGTLAMFHHGGEPWEEWNGRLRDTLVSTQRKTGHAAGSWDPRDRWSSYGGRIYSTALSTLSLEVYYRFLPLYRQAPRHDD